MRQESPFASIQPTSLPDSTAAGTAPTPDVQSRYKPFHTVQPFDKVPWQFLDDLIAFYCELTEPRILARIIREWEEIGRQKKPPLLQTC